MLMLVILCMVPENNSFKFSFPSISSLSLFPMFTLSCLSDPMLLSIDLIDAILLFIDIDMDNSLTIDRWSNGTYTYVKMYWGYENNPCFVSSCLSRKLKHFSLAVGWRDMTCSNTSAVVTPMYRQNNTWSEEITNRKWVTKLNVNTNWWHTKHHCKVISCIDR